MNAAAGRRRGPGAAPSCAASWPTTPACAWSARPPTAPPRWPSSHAQPDAVDAVLLDIQMPGRSGLEVAAALPPHVLVAFTTAFDEYAVQAFELNAVDYLLKPFTRERLAACVARLRERLAPPERAQQRQRLTTALHALQPVADHWLVADRGEMRRVPLADIECVSRGRQLHRAALGRGDLARPHDAGGLPRPSGGAAASCACTARAPCSRRACRRSSRWAAATRSCGWRRGAASGCRGAIGTSGWRALRR